jgi:hypothetical protein
VSTDRDRWDDNDSRRGDRRDDSPDEIRRIAEAKVATPAMLMIVAAVIMFLLMLVSVGMIASGYDPSVAILEAMHDAQPPGKGKDDLKKQIDEAKTRDKSTDYILNVASIVANLVFNVLVLVGGLKMKSLSSHTLAMIGAIAAIIPLNSCCCIGIPIGIWSLITLMNPDVKAAFALNARGGSALRDRDEGWGAVER